MNACQKIFHSTVSRSNTSLCSSKAKVSYSFLRETFNGFGAKTQPKNWKNCKFLWLHSGNKINLSFKIEIAKRVPINEDIVGQLEILKQKIILVGTAE